MFLELPLRQVDPQVCNKLFLKKNDTVENVASTMLQFVSAAVPLAQSTVVRGEDGVRRNTSAV